MYQFAEVTSLEAHEHEILTVCTARPAGEAHGRLRVSQKGREWRVTGTHGKLKVDVRITPGDGNAAPQVAVK
jgi:hypothetical protein